MCQWRGIGKFCIGRNGKTECQGKTQKIYWKYSNKHKYIGKSRIGHNIKTDCQGKTSQMVQENMISCQNKSQQSNMQTLPQVNMVFWVMMMMMLATMVCPQHWKMKQWRKKAIRDCKTQNSRSKGVTEENDQDNYLLYDANTIKYKYKYEYNQDKDPLAKPQTAGQRGSRRKIIKIITLFEGSFSSHLYFPLQPPL